MNDDQPNHSQTPEPSETPGNPEALQPLSGSPQRTDVLVSGVGEKASIPEAEPVSAKPVVDPGPAPPIVGPLGLAASTHKASFSVWEIIWGFCCLVGGAALRLTNLQGKPLWADEFVTLITIRRPILDSLTTLQDPHPPLHPLLVRLAAMGEYPSLWAMRGPALLFGCLAILAAWWFARTVFGRWIAALTVGLVAIDPMMVSYSREARPYALFVFMALMSMTFFYRLIQDGGKKNLIGYAVFTALSMYCHFFAVFFIAGQVVFAATDLWFCGCARARVRELAIAFAAAFAGMAPPVGLLLFQLLRETPGAGWISETRLVDSFDQLGNMIGLAVFGGLAMIPIVSVFWPGRTPFEWRRGGGEGIELDGAFSDTHASEHNQAGGVLAGWWLGRKPAILCATWVIFSFFVPVVISDFGKPIFVLRYALPAAVPLLALGLAYLWRANRLALALVVALLAAEHAAASAGQLNGEIGMPQIVQWIEAQTKPDEPVMVAHYPFCDDCDWINPEEVGLTYYGLRDRPIGHLPIKTFERVDPGDPDQFLPTSRAYVVCFMGTVDVVTRALGHHGRPYRLRRFGLLTVCVVEPKPI